MCYENFYLYYILYLSSTYPLLNLYQTSTNDYSPNYTSGFRKTIRDTPRINKEFTSYVPLIHLVCGFQTGMK